MYFYLISKIKVKRLAFIVLWEEGMVYLYGLVGEVTNARSV